MPPDAWAAFFHHAGAIPFYFVFRMSVTSSAQS